MQVLADRRTTLSPRWATILAIVDAIAAVLFFGSAFGLRVFLPRLFAVPDFLAFVWLIVAGALAMRRA